MRYAGEVNGKRERRQLTREVRLQFVGDRPGKGWNLRAETVIDKAQLAQGTICDGDEKWADQGRRPGQPPSPGALLLVLHELPEDGVHAGLVALSLALEPVDDVLIETKVIWSLGIPPM